MTRMLVAGFVALGAFGCGDDAEGAGEGEGPGEAEADEAPPADPPRFAVHEWGLLDVVLAEGTAELGAGPGDPTAPGAQPAEPPVAPSPTGMLTVAPAPSNIATDSVPMRRRKPVVYVHLLERAREATFSLTVTPAPGHLIEHWPPGNQTDTALTWPSVIARGGDCEPAAYPEATDARCANLEDGYCEVAELEAYETEDGACLTVDGNQYDHLFYRGGGSAPPLPFAVQMDGTTMRLAWSATTRPVGTILRVTRADGAVAVGSVAAEDCDDEVTLASPTSGDVDAARAAISASLRELGLSDDEARAFERAWMDELFGEAGSMTDALLYFLPQELVQPMASLAFDPEPHELRRVFLVRVDLGAAP